MRRTESDILRSYVRALLEGAVPDDDPAPGGSPSAPSDEDQAALDVFRTRISEADEIAGRISSNMLRAFQADVSIPGLDNTTQIQQEIKFTDLLADAAAKDVKYPSEFPICTAVVLAAIDTGDLQNGPALLHDVYEGVKSVFAHKVAKESKETSLPVLGESFIGEAGEAYLKKILVDVVEELSKKKLVRLGTEAEINRFVRELAGGLLRIPANGLVGATEKEAKQVIKEMILESVNVASIKGAKKDLEALKDVATRLADDEASLVRAAEELSYLYKQGRYFARASQGTASVVDASDDVLSVFNRMQQSDQLDVVQDAGLANVQQFRDAVSNLRGDADEIVRFCDAAMTNQALMKSIINTGTRQAKQVVSRAGIFAWDMIKTVVLSGKEAFFSAGTGPRWIRAITAASSVATLFQLIFKDPQLARDYKTVLKLSDSLVTSTLQNWAEGANLDEIADDMETLFDPGNASLTKAIAIVRAFEQNRGSTTGSDLAVSG